MKAGMDPSKVSSTISCELEELMDKKFEGSLPAFIAAFGRRQELSDAEIEEIRRIIER